MYVCPLFSFKLTAVWLLLPVVPFPKISAKSKSSSFCHFVALVLGSDSTKYAKKSWSNAEFKQALQNLNSWNPENFDYGTVVGLPQIEAYCVSPASNKVKFIAYEHLISFQN